MINLHNKFLNTCPKIYLYSLCASLHLLSIPLSYGWGAWDYALNCVIAFCIFAGAVEVLDAKIDRKFAIVVRFIVAFQVISIYSGFMAMYDGYHHHVGFWFDNYDHILFSLNAGELSVLILGVPWGDIRDVISRKLSQLRMGSTAVTNRVIHSMDGG